MHTRDTTKETNQKMKHSISDQVQAVKEAITLIKIYVPENNEVFTPAGLDWLKSSLNDAGSTLAALNLNKENKIGWSNLREALNEKLKP